MCALARYACESYSFRAQSQSSCQAPDASTLFVFGESPRTPKYQPLTIVTTPSQNDAVRRSPAAPMRKRVLGTQSTEPPKDRTLFEIVVFLCLAACLVKAYSFAPERATFDSTSTPRQEAKRQERACQNQAGDRQTSAGEASHQQQGSFGKAGSRKGGSTQACSSNSRRSMSENEHISFCADC